MIKPDQNLNRRHSSRALQLALVAGVALLGGAPLQAQAPLGVLDLVFADGFELSGTSCSGVAPGSIARQTGGQWYLGNTLQGSADFTDILRTQSSQGTPWPGTQSGTGRTYMIGANNYVALQFHTGATAPGSIGQYQVTQSFVSPAASYMSISECPGDFRTASIDDNCEMPLSGKNALFWIVGQPSSFRCVLDTDKTYYLNIVLADPANISASSCANSFCGVRVVPIY